jgi:hypothetical protein
MPGSGGSLEGGVFQVEKRKRREKKDGDVKSPLQGRVRIGIES